MSLAAAKAYLRVDDAAEDGLIATLITAARLHVEAITGRALVAQSWRLVLDAWPVCRSIELPIGPMLSLTVITAYDAEGDEHLVPLAQFIPETRVSPARLLLPLVIAGMPDLRERRGLEIDYVAGFGETGDDVPADVTHALQVLIAYWFEHRDAVIVAGSGAVVPAGFDRLVSPYKRVRL